MIIIIAIIIIIIIVIILIFTAATCLLGKFELRSSALQISFSLNLYYLVKWGGWELPAVRASEKDSAIRQYTDSWAMQTEVGADWVWCGPSLVWTELDVDWAWCGLSYDFSLSFFIYLLPGDENGGRFFNWHEDGSTISLNPLLIERVGVSQCQSVIAQVEWWHWPVACLSKLLESV